MPDRRAAAAGEGGGSRMRNRWKVSVVMAALALTVVGAVPAQAQTTEYPREQTLYTSGTQWGPPSNWNPIMDWAYAMGTLGLVYEPLFNYDPLTNKYIPWLAESGSWTSKTEYTLKLRDGITWADGKPLTADDVVYTVELGKMPSVPYSTIWNFLDKAEKVNELTVKFTFKSAQYQQWANFLYNRAILPKHIWEGRTEKEVMGANEKPVGSGPYKFVSSDQNRQVWEKRADWWGVKALGLDPKPKYIIDIVNGSNNAALGQVLQGGIDLSNNFLPGIATLLKGGYGKSEGNPTGLQTYYDKPPYMLSANTAWLATNDTKAPLNDPAFRKALASSVNVDTIVNTVYGQIVKASDPTGLLVPPWQQYIDKSVVDKLGFKYDPEGAKKMLADAGYKDVNGDGMVENKDGSAIALKLIVPNGWSDWMESIKVIAESGKAVGINVTPDYPDYGARTEAIQNGKFDLAIVNDQQLSNTPWTYYNWIFRQPIQDVQNAGNFGRYESKEAWDLVQQLDQTPVEDTVGMKAVISKLQEIQLKDLPLIPLWFNGAWSQASNAVWTNWPSDGGNHFLPITWRGYWQMGAVRMLDALKLAAQP
jgi:peptide/nickel transport system substrate-binding protein